MNHNPNDIRKKLQEILMKRRFETIKQIKDDMNTILSGTLYCNSDELKEGKINKKTKKHFPLSDSNRYKISIKDTQSYIEILFPNQQKSYNLFEFDYNHDSDLSSYSVSDESPYEHFNYIIAQYNILNNNDDEFVMENCIDVNNKLEFIRKDGSKMYKLCYNINIQPKDLAFIYDKKKDILKCCNSYIISIDYNNITRIFFDYNNTFYKDTWNNETINKTIFSKNNINNELSFSFKTPILYGYDKLKNNNIYIKKVNDCLSNNKLNSDNFLKLLNEYSIYIGTSNPLINNYTIKHNNNKLADINNGSGLNNIIGLEILKQKNPKI